MAYDYLKRKNPPRANKEYIAILYMAAKEGESLTESAIRCLLSKEQPLSVESLRQMIAKENKMPPITDIAIADVSLGAYDELLNIREEAVIHG